MPLFSLPVNDYGLGAAGANLIAATNGPLASTLPQQILETYDGTVFSTYSLGLVDPIPAFWAYKTSSATIVIVQATRTVRQAAGIINGYGQLPEAMGDGGINPFYKLVCDTLAPQIVAFVGGSSNPVLFLGHSLGGALAQALALYPQFAAPREVKVVTYGAPRVGDRVFAAGFNETPNCRWMIATDPVPLLPPRPVEAPLFWIVLGQQAAMNSTEYVQADGGILLNANGTTTIAPTPPLSTNFGETDLASWLLAFDTANANPHDISLYLQYLNFLHGQNPTPTPRRIGAPEMQLRPRGLDGELHTLANDAFDAIEATRPSGGSQDVIVNPALGPTTSSMGKVSYVYLNKQVIALAQSKAGARSIERNLRKVLKGLGAAVQVDVAGFTSQLNVILNSMADSPYQNSIPLNDVTPTVL